MRIITGSARGTVLSSLEGENTRPTLERAKESILSAIQFDIEGRRALDLYAGSGQIGLELLSRGAEKATFVDSSPDAFKVIEENAKKTKLYKQCVILNMDVFEYLKAAKRSKPVFDLVFIDPPYAQNLLPKTLSALREASVCPEGALIIAESDNDELFEQSPELSGIYELLKIYKIGKIYFYKMTIARQ